MKKTLYGIPNCDTVKKARTWLAEQRPGRRVPRLQEAGPGPRHRRALARADRLGNLVNRKGTTWRKLTDERRAQVVDKASALELMLENPSVIKRPVLEGAGPLKVGFSADAYEHLFGDWPA
jgi:arsenate reductase